MKITDLIQSYTALTQSEVAGNIAKNIASSVSADKTSGPVSAEDSATIQPGASSTAAQQADVPDSFQHKRDTRAASQSLIGLRAPTTTGFMGLSAGGVLNKLVASYIASADIAATEAAADENVSTEVRDSRTPASIIQPPVASKNGTHTPAIRSLETTPPAANGLGPEDSKSGPATASQSRGSEVTHPKNALPSQPGASASAPAGHEARFKTPTSDAPVVDKATAHLQQPSPQTMAALLRNLTGQTTPLAGVVDGQNATDVVSEEALQETEKAGITGQHANPRLPADKSTTTANIPPQSINEEHSTDQNDPQATRESLRESARGSAKEVLRGESLRGERLREGAREGVKESARENVRESLSPAQAALAKALQAHALSEQAAARQMHASGRMELPGEMLLKTISNDQVMAQMHGMDAAILNAAMIPGWPAPRPFAMPKQLPSGQTQRVKHNDAETTGQLGTPNQSKGKEAQGRSEVAIQNYLLNMGLKKSLMHKLRNSLRPAKKKAKVMFGLAVLITQTVFALHTVMSELNELEENEDDMMNDPGNQKRRLKG